MTDTRIAYLPPAGHTLSAQDATAGPFFIQQKFPAYTSPLRVASKLEAGYIEAEAQTTADQLVWINARRTAGGQGAYAGAGDAASVLAELMRQKHLDFWLEGQRFGDSRRNPAAVANMPVPDSDYFKPDSLRLARRRATCFRSRRRTIIQISRSLQSDADPKT